MRKNVKIHLRFKIKGWDSVDSIQLPQDMDCRQVLVNTGMTFTCICSIKGGQLVANWAGQSRETEKSLNKCTYSFKVVKLFLKHSV
jgi:hypothetical protein